MPAVRGSALGLAVATLVAFMPASAASAGAGFEIQVTLQGPRFLGGAGGGEGRPVRHRGRNRDQLAACTGLADADERKLFVQVFCSVGSYVSIAPAPGQAIDARHAQWYRTSFAPGSAMARSLATTSWFDPQVAAGTVTALQLTNATGASPAVEMLVTF